MWAARLQDFLISLKIALPVPEITKLMSSPESCRCRPIAPTLWILVGIIYPFSLMNIFMVIVPVPLFIPWIVISFISLKSISRFFLSFYSALVSGRISESKNSLILLLTVFLATNGSCPSIFAFLTMFCISSISSGLSTLWLYLLAEK